MLKNIIYLLFNQGANYLLPLLSVPILIRRIGYEGFGVVAMGQAILTIALVFTDYGFNYTAVKEASKLEDKNKGVGGIFTEVLSAKVALFLIFSVGFIFAHSLGFVKNLDDKELIYLMCSIALASLNPLWIYQVFGEMRVVTVINISSKFLSLLCIYLFITDANKTPLAMLFQLMGFSIPGVIGISYALIKFNLKLKIVMDFRYLHAAIKKGWPVFITTVSGNIYGQGPVILLGGVFGAQVAGQYGFAQKILSAIAGLAQPFSLVLYPELCRLWNREDEKFRRYFDVSSLCIFVFGCAISLIYYFSIPFIESILLHVVDEGVDFILRIQTPMIILLIGNVVINCFAMACADQNKVKKVYIYAAIIFLMVSCPVVEKYNSVGMIVVVSGVEFFIFLNLFVMVRKCVGVNHEK